MLVLTGICVFVKQEKSQKGQYYKRLQFQVGGGERRMGLVDVTDMSNAEWVFGREYSLVVDVQAFQGKMGFGMNCTCWDGLLPSVINTGGASVGNTGALKAAGAPPPPSASTAGPTSAVRGLK